MPGKTKSKKTVPAKSNGKHPGGRPAVLYDPELYPEMAEVACAEGGFTNAKLAKLFNISGSKLDEWIADYPEFMGAVKSGREKWDNAKVRAALMKSATGIRYTETTREAKKVYDDDGKEIGVTSDMAVTKKVSKFIAPNYSSMAFWLCNRDRENWKHAKAVELSGVDGKPITIEDAQAGLMMELMERIGERNKQNRGKLPQYVDDQGANE